MGLYGRRGRLEEKAPQSGWEREILVGFPLQKTDGCEDQCMLSSILLQPTTSPLEVSTTRDSFAQVELLCCQRADRRNKQRSVWGSRLHCGCCLSPHWSHAIHGDLLSCTCCPFYLDSETSRSHGHHHKRKLRRGAQREARARFWIIVVELNVGRGRDRDREEHRAELHRATGETARRSRVCVFISAPRPWERSGGCRAEVEQRLGGAATPACSPSEPQSRTSSRGARLSSAERSRRVNTHSLGRRGFKPPSGLEL